MRLESGWRARNYRLERQFHQSSQPREAARCRPLLPSPLPLRHQPTRACAFAGARDCSPFGVILRHAVGFNNRQVESPLHFRHQLGRQRGGTGSYEAQPRWLRNATSNGDPFKDGLVYGWNRSEPSGLELFHPIQNLRNVKAGCAHHAGTMHMEKRHDVQATVHLGEFQRTDDILSGEN